MPLKPTKDNEPTTRASFQDKNRTSAWNSKPWNSDSDKKADTDESAEKRESNEDYESEVYRGMRSSKK